MGHYAENGTNDSALKRHRASGSQLPNINARLEGGKDKIGDVHQ